MGKFDGQVAIITGASSGIGGATALALVREGAKVVITGRSKERLAETAKLCKKAGGEVLEVVADVANVESLESLVDQTVKKFSKINILVNNAGYGMTGPIEKLAVNEYEKIFQTNLRAPVFLCKYALPHLKKTKGSIVNISSVAGLRSIPNGVTYCMTKAALDHFTRGFAAECVQAGIRVNSVNPAVVKTRFGERLGLDSKTLDATMKNYEKEQPLGFLEPEDIADSILYLLSSKYTTGITLPVDGGLMLPK